MRSGTFFLLICSFSFRGIAAFEEVPLGSSLIGMGGTSVAVPGSPWTFLANPALLPSAGKSAISAFYTPGLYGLKELKHAALAFHHPFSFGSLGLHASVAGFELYKEVVAGLSCGWELSDRITIGTTFRYLSLTIENYGSQSALGIDIGVALSVSPELHWGFSIHNVNKPVIGEADERLPQVLRTGVFFAPVAHILLAIDVVKDIRYPAEVRLGLEYRLINMIALRAGGSVEPGLVSVGLGIYNAPVTFDYALTSHPVLGITHSVTITLGAAGVP